MRFLLDMGISPKISIWLNLIGHEAIHLNEERLNYLSDEAIIDKAAEEDRIILTADMDFGNLLALNKSKQVSIIQFRLSDFKSINIQSKLEMLFEKFSEQLDEDFIITVEDNRLRFRKLPI